MRKEKYYTLRVTFLHLDGRKQICMYSMTRKEFDLFFEKTLKLKGSEILSIEDIKEPMRYYA